MTVSKGETVVMGYWIFVSSVALLSVIGLCWLFCTEIKHEHNRQELVRRANPPSKAEQKYRRWWHR